MTVTSTSRRGGRTAFTLVGHAHIDPVWLWNWREGYETVRATVRSALDRLRENPDMVFVHSSPAQYAWLEDHPALLAEVRAAVERGQWEPVGGWWVEPDVNLAGGEALVRQGLYGQRYFEKVLGRRARIAFLPDSFGHPGTLPQLFVGAGLDSFLFMRPQANEIELPANLFWWEGPDGSRVLALRVECYNTNPVHITSSLERNLEWCPADAEEWIGLFGVGNHGGGPTKAAIRSIREHAADPGWPELRLGSLEGFFDRARTREHPAYRGELQHHARGCYSAHAEVKRLNRLAEERLLAAERWAALASLGGHPYPAADLERAWKRLLFNQFHDILAGSSVESAYEDARDELGEALATAARVEFGALSVLASKVDTRREGRPVEEVIRRTRWNFDSWVADLGDGVPVVAFNPSPWARRETLEVEVNDWHEPELRLLDSEGRPVPHQLVRPESASGARPRIAFHAELPALGYQVYRVVDEPPAPLPEDAPPLIASEHALENRWWRLEVDPQTGAISSLYDKERRLELLAGPGARLLVVEDPTDTWGHGMVSMREVAGAFGNAQVALLESGPVRATLAARVSFGGSSAVQEITLYRDTRAIRGRLELDWRERHRALKLAFPFALEEVTATFEVPYGHAKRPASGEEEPLQRWLDASGVARDANGAPHPCGVALLNTGQYGGDVLEGEVRLTILRSPVYAHHDPAKLEPDVSYRYQDQGRHEMRWGLVPHGGDWRAAGVVEAAHDLNAPLAFVREYAHEGEWPAEGGLLTVEPPGALVATALKRAEEGDDLVLRLFEPGGRPAGARVRLPLLGADFEVELRPHEIRTYRIGRNGAAREVNLLEE